MIPNFMLFVYTVLLCGPPIIFVFWVGGMIDLAMRIRNDVKAGTYPRKWLRLSFLPYLGHWYRHNLNHIAFQIEPIDLQEEPRPPCRNISKSGWLLIQEHIDDPLPGKKGSTLTFLDSVKRTYDFKETDHLPDENESIIRVTLPRHYHLDVVWAKLHYNVSVGGNPGWKIENCGDEPILIGSEKDYSSLLRGQMSETLESRQTFFIGTAIYTLYKLPSLGLRYRVLSQSKNLRAFGKVKSGLILIGANDICNIKIKKTGLFMFQDGELTSGDFKGFSYQPTGFLEPHFFNEVQSDESNLGDPGLENWEKVKSKISQNKSIQLFPGDKFVINSYEFLVDYEDK